jgi:acetyl esterase/lipase
MASWQSRVLRLAQHGFRAFSGRFAGLDVAQERRNGQAVERWFKAPPAVDFAAVTANGVPAAWVTPLGPTTEPVVVYVHGGAFYSGTLAGTRPVAGQIALAAHARVLTFAYRLAPEHPFPAALNDTLAVYEWLLAIGVAPERLVVVGDSAGGTLALALLVLLRDQGKPLPRGAVCLSPATDLTLAGETWTRNAKNDLLLDAAKIKAAVDLYLGDANPRAPLASPLYADLHALPPLLILVGSDECLLSDATRFAAKAQAAGVPVDLEVWNRMQHGWHITAPFLPEGRQALARIGQFIQQGSARLPAGGPAGRAESLAPPPPAGPDSI